MRAPRSDVGVEGIYNSPQKLQKPAGFTTPGDTAATTLGNRLVLATNWVNGSRGTTAVWSSVVNPG